MKRPSKRDSIEVVLDADFLASPTLVGTMFRASGHGNEVFSFRYHPDWLKNSSAVAIDPQLMLADGEFYPDQGSGAFRAFMDSAPDRWGRVLLDRREVLRAKDENRPVRALTEWNYLLGVHDSCRLGALRFRPGTDSAFLDDDTGFAVPPLSTLRELEAAAQALEDPRASDHPSYRKWLATILEPGSSLGGARPKSNFLDVDGSLWIAKFPSRNDRHDIGAWEKVLHTLAQRADINVPQARLLPGKEHHTFACQRFDRVGARRRFFVSAMTLLGRNDGQKASYLDLAEFLSMNVGPKSDDLRQLWTRMVFNILVGNRDDHLRNHGFILSQNIWRLAPAYDVNPTSEKAGHALMIDAHNNSGDIELALKTAKYYGLSEPAAQATLTKTREAVAGWRTVAETLELPRSEIEHLSAAFQA